MNNARSRRLLATAGALLVVVAHASPAGARPERAVQLQARPLAAVAAIAVPPVRVRCTIPPADAGEVDALGHVVWKKRLIELAPSICRNANALAFSPARPYSRASYRQAQAVLVVVHESVHLSDYIGRTDEALTECRAIQLVREAALLIGVEDETARALGHEAMRFDAQLPGPDNWMVGLHELPNYHSPDCYDGGPLDIHPESSDWPN
jgi:hypothetical protein